METVAVVLQQPETLTLSRIPLSPPTDRDVVVDMEWSGISTGTERLLWSGTMPTFPGMGYPLVPGYESVGRVTRVGAQAGGDLAVGDRVFVPGARCYGDIRGLFGGSASRVVVPADRVAKIDGTLDREAVLLALAATAYHVTRGDPATQPDLVVGHGVLGRLIARIALAVGAPAPTVWEVDPERRSGAEGYTVVDPQADPRRDYRRICDVSGAKGLLDTLIGRLAFGGEVVLAGFYTEPLSFTFPPAFMREARLRIAAEWKHPDLAGVMDLIDRSRLSLAGLITHAREASDAPEAYRTAFTDPACLKMIIDWRTCS